MYEIYDKKFIWDKIVGKLNEVQSTHRGGQAKY